MYPIFHLLKEDYRVVGFRFRVLELRPKASLPSTYAKIRSGRVFLGVSGSGTIVIIVQVLGKYMQVFGFWVLGPLG